MGRPDPDRSLVGDPSRDARMGPKQPRNCHGSGCQQDLDGLGDCRDQDRGV